MILRYDQGMNTHPDATVKIIENARRDDVRPGDHVVFLHDWKRDGLTVTARREGVAHHLDDGNWCTEAGMYITVGVGDDITLTIRRPVPELPTEDGAVIIANDGREFIEARVYNKTYRAREAVRHWAGGWHAAWRSGPEVRGVVAPEEITPGTWRTADDPR